MSVYTKIEPQELKNFLNHYNLDHLIEYNGINAGIENTNYFVSTSSGEFVLTLFEGLTAEELPYFLKLMAYLAEHNIPSAHPIADKNGEYLRQLKGKPAALVERLSGTDVKEPNIIQCQQIGKALGNLHLISPNFPDYRSNKRGSDWWKITAERVLPLMTTADAKLLKAELEFQGNYQLVDLPTGVIHADLFRDNALFEGNKLSGIIDFYYACNDILIYDLAVTVNDWCVQADGSLDTKRVDALVESYIKQRPLSDLELETWSTMLRAAALRFWLSRLQDLHFPRPGEITHIKNPDVFRNILQEHI
ncbi:homoserine kinase [Candidatus Marithrix sp. Canyon 246]|uniref:homoserine kinase n=1 Tax=Candidatus Marithrix sp. Canyon 246 TaxID=1827136 RepID=UPI00084A2A25|nr:homoserine kinase [Candidatus Marithrix sp. Canyon 246]